MKIKKITGYPQKLLKLKIIKTKNYKKKHQLTCIKIEDIETRLKKALNVINSYHINNKRILFISNALFSNDRLKNLFKTTHHILIPESIWVPGILNNNNQNFKLISKEQKVTNTKISKLLLQLKRGGDLIVLFNKQLNNNALEEGYNSLIPLISLEDSLNIFDIKSSYKIPGNYKFTKQKIRDNFFASILVATLKKSIKIKSKNFYLAGNKQRQNTSFNSHKKIFNNKTSKNKK